MGPEKKPAAKRKERTAKAKATAKSKAAMSIGGTLVERLLDRAKRRVVPRKVEDLDADAPQEPKEARRVLQVDVVEAEDAPGLRVARIPAVQRRCHPLLEVAEVLFLRDAALL